MQTPNVGDTDNVLLRKMLLNQSGAGGEVTSGGETVPYVIDYLGSGAAGSETFDDTNPHTGSWFCVLAASAVATAVEITLSRSSSFSNTFTPISVLSGVDTINGLSVLSHPASITPTSAQI